MIEDAGSPKRVGSPYIPQNVDKKVDNARESAEDAGSFNFVFYGRGGKKGGKPAKKPPPTVGPPVELHLSKEAAEQCLPEPQKGPGENEPEKQPEPDTKKTGGEGDGDGHVNITV